MKVYFKPFWGLTLFVLIATVILLSLGTWQYQRLGWKTKLLAEVDAAIKAPPLGSMSDILKAYSRGEPVDFRRFDLMAMPQNMSAPYMVYVTRNKETYWRPYVPITGPDGGAMFAALKGVPDEEKARFSEADLPSSVTRFVGYVRKAHTPRGISAWVEPKASGSQNRYFRFNQTGDWDTNYTPPIDMALYLDVNADVPDGASLPIKRPEIRNNHFDYMLTWYSFAVILWIIYILLHLREGRLRFRRPQD